MADRTAKDKFLLLVAPRWTDLRGRIGCHTDEAEVNTEGSDEPDGYLIATVLLEKVRESGNRLKQRKFGRSFVDA